MLGKAILKPCQGSCPTPHARAYIYFTLIRGIESKLPIMKGRTTFVSLLLCVAGLAALSDSSAVTLMGSVSRGQWIEHHKRNDGRDLVALAENGWIVGYLSGKASVTRTDVIADPDAASIILWVSNYCGAHPLDYIHKAGDVLFDELAERKGR